MHTATTPMKKPAGATTPPTGLMHTSSPTVMIVQHGQPADKAFANAQAAFALRGHTLTRSLRADDGAATYTVHRWGMARVFSHWGDVLAFLAQVGG